MENYRFLLDIAIILVITKFAGLLTRRINMPQVLGALFAGIILGPAIFNIIRSFDTLNSFSEIGVIILMFAAGLETNLKELKKTWKGSLFIATMGVILPLIGGYFLSKIYGMASLESIFIGVILTATSVSITVETLQEMGHLKTKTGTAILGAAIIDDLLGIMILSLVIGSKGQASFSFATLIMTLTKILGFTVFCIFCGIVAYKLLLYIYMKYGKVRRLAILMLAFCFFLAYMAERFGLADITGAYIAGLILSRIQINNYMEQKIEILSYILFSPIFFASMGLKIPSLSFTSTTLLFTALLLIIAILSKVLGCGFAAKLVGFNTDESMKIGLGMISRGEVALIVANKGINAGIMNPQLFSGVIFVVIATTLITPILLKKAYANEKAVTE